MNIKLIPVPEEDDRIGAAIVDSAFRVHTGLRPGLLESVLIELKSVETLAPVHFAQLMTYLRLSELRLGYLMNFNSKYIKFGVKRIVV
jgi:hypothetical protein